MEYWHSLVSSVCLDGILAIFCLVYPFGLRNMWSRNLGPFIEILKFNLLFT
jgi:hypothetical protein